MPDPGMLMYEEKQQRNDAIRIVENFLPSKALNVHCDHETLFMQRYGMRINDNVQWKSKVHVINKNKFFIINSSLKKVKGLLQRLGLCMDM
jgi:acetone carboxylase gamma subunit